MDFKIVSDLTIKAESNGKDFTHYLDNAFKEYKLQPDSLTEVIKRYVNSSSELYNEPAERHNADVAAKTLGFVGDHLCPQATQTLNVSLEPLNPQSNPNGPSRNAMQQPAAAS